MLQVIFTADEKVLKPLYESLYPDDSISGANFVLLDGEAAVGVCSLELGERVKIKKFALMPEIDNLANTDFFFRVVLFKLSFNDYIVEVDAVDDRLSKFGFEEDDGKMYLRSKDVKFPSGCGGQK